ncbi:hypothetical protein [Bacillus cereus]|uniref:hypothetical protein n=1 Tax=Bacillus cereus TaxID=1396 RepID=UPI0030192A9B
MGSKIEYWISEMKKQGIKNEHVEAMKDRKLISDYEYSLYYEEDETKKEPVLIDVNKIKGLTTLWDTKDRSIYELFFSVTGELSLSRDPLHCNRIEENMDSLIKNGRQYQYKFYVDASLERYLRDGLPNFDYYQDDDIYFSGATHRTVSAIMFGAPNMVGYVTTYKKNMDKYENFLIHKTSLQKWRSFLNSEFNCITIKQHGKTNEEYSVGLKDFPNTQLNFTFYNPVVEPIPSNIADKSIFEKEEKTIQELIRYLHQVDDYLNGISRKLGVLPLSLRVLKKSNLRLPYLLVSLLYNKEVYHKINDSPELTVKKIRKIIRNEIIIKSVPQEKHSSGIK